MLSTVSASRAHKVIGALRDTTDATVVPQLPPPSSPTFNRMNLSLFFGRVAAQSVLGKKALHHRGGCLRVLDHRHMADMVEDMALASRDPRFEYRHTAHVEQQIGRAVQQECRDRSRMPSSA
eukprot:TRINITY_DN99911_c0_g2_i1.p1 TRINITY_DN99911_c0_g2~~TRINITY_DN99911_c0_g2_i1.p1  ORF type:complete len:122 (-),score=18.81 TRINITY_DN99911_c0_g2_i1:10-375(-)